MTLTIFALWELDVIERVMRYFSMILSRKRLIILHRRCTYPPFLGFFVFPFTGLLFAFLSSLSCQHIILIAAIPHEERTIENLLWLSSCPVRLLLILEATHFILSL